MLRGPHRSSLYRIVAIGALIAGALVAGTAMAAPATPARSCDKTSGDSAIAACTRAIDSGKFKGHKLAILFSNRGAEWSKKGQHDRAITDYNEAIGLDSNYAFAYNGRGNAYLAKRDNVRAIADYDQAIRLDPKLASAYNNRGNAYRAKGDNDRATADYDQAIRIDPKHINAYTGRGLAYRAKGDIDRAIADFTQATRLGPKLVFAYNLRGNAYRAKGDNDHAIADYTQAIQLDSNYAFAYNGRGLSNQAKGDNERAIADFTEAIRVDHAFTFAYGNRGHAYLAKGDNERAIADYNAALKLDRQSSSLYGRGVAKLKTGDAAGSNADIAAAKAIQANIADEFARYGARSIDNAAGSVQGPKPASVPAAAFVAHVATVKEVFEKYNLLGTFAWTCSQPASDQNNWYYVNRVIDADHVQRDRMTGPTTRAAMVIIDKATESKPNEVTVGGTLDGQHFDGIWVIEKTRMLQWEAWLAGKKNIAEGHLTKTGLPMPWLNRCDAKEPIHLNLAGQWKSNWGPFTIQVAANGSMSGSWVQKDGTGVLDKGVFDPLAGTLVFSMYQPWNKATGTASFKLSQDGTALTGMWSIKRANGSDDYGSWTVTR